MAYRNFPFASSIPEMNRDQFQNTQTSFPENGSIVFQPHQAAASGVISTPYPNMPVRSNDYPPSNMEITHYMPPTSGSSAMHRHLLSGSSSSHMPSTYIQHGPPNNQYVIRSDEHMNFNPQVESGRGSIKRKSPAIYMFSDMGSTSRYYNCSSSDVTAPADHHQKPWFGSHQLYGHPNSSVYNYSANSLPTSSECSQRNVRSRYTHLSHVNPSSSGTQFTNDLVCHFPPGGSFPPGPVLNERWCSNPLLDGSHGRTSSGTSGFSRINPTLVSSTGNIYGEASGSHYTIPGRHTGVQLPNFVCHPGGTNDGQSNCRQRGGPSQRSTTCYPNMVFTPSYEVGQSAPGAFSRHSRPLSISGGRSAERNGKGRFPYVRHQSYSDDNGNRGRWNTEGAFLMDQAALYDTSNLFDQHREMRLDIDNMTYEELLALEERIGSVNTGLSEDMMPKCLTATLYCSSNQMESSEERSCAICLESYKEEDKLGTLKCRHDYHVECIRKWLLMKNVCPICKVPALEDDSKE